MNPGYLFPRLLRHFLPEGVTRFLLLRSLIIKPGLETVDPAAAVGRYADVLGPYNETLRGRRILVFGYGGRFDIGVGLLEAGATHVALCDKYARPDDRHNRQLLPVHSDLLQMEAGRPRPLGQRLELIHADLGDIDPPRGPQRYDLVISNSVYEHLEDAEGITRALAKWTAPKGMHIHFVDLRDHYFRYPFEMLRYTEETWRRWLNPTSNHNRLRLWHYRRIFESYFHEVDVQVTGRDEAAFGRVRAHIRPEFISGNEEDDTVTLMRITARAPRD